MPKPVIRADHPRELLAAIPYQLGFRPSESLVAVSLRPPRSTVGLMIRLDLDDLAGRDHGLDVARSLAGHLGDDGARRVALVVCTERLDDLRRHVGVPGRALGAARSALTRRWRVDSWWIGRGRFGSLDCTDPACCPPQGWPTSDLESTAVSAHMVLAGAVVQPTRAALGVQGEADGTARLAATEAARAERARERDESGRSGSIERAAVHERWGRLCAAAAHGTPIPPEELGRAVVGLENRHLRDEILARHAVGPAIGRPVLGAEAGAEAIFGTGGPVPAPGSIAPFRAVLEEMVRHLPGPASGPPLAVLACLAWWQGEGARSSVLVEQCLEVDPGYRLAHLVDDALQAGVAPGWARSGRARGSGAPRSGRTVA